MTSPLTAARTRVADALTGVGVPVFDQPPGSPPQPPHVLIVPGNPWIAPGGHVTLEVVCVANPAGGNAAALDRLEQLVHAVREALYAGQLAAGTVDPPTVDSTAGVLSCSMPVILRVSCH